MFYSIYCDFFEFTINSNDKLSNTLIPHKSDPTLSFPLHSNITLTGCFLPDVMVNHWWLDHMFVTIRNLEKHDKNNGVT